MTCSQCNREPCNCIGSNIEACHSLRVRLNMMGITDPKALVQRFIDKGKIGVERVNQAKSNSDILRLLPPL